MKAALRILVVLVCFAVPGLSQSAEQLRGISPFHSYEFNDTDTVELSHGNVILNIPIVSYKQKGQLPSFDVKLIYSAKNWEYSQQVTEVNDNNYYYYIWDMNAVSTDPHTGITSVRPNGVQVATGATYDVIETLGNTNIFDPNVGFTYLGYRLNDNQGSSHPISRLTADQPTLAALDASGFTLKYSYAQAGAAIVRDRQGIQYSASNCNPGCTRSIKDTLGTNVITGYASSTFPYGIDHWVDSVNRTIPQLPDTFTGCITINYPGVNQGSYPVIYCKANFSASTAFPIDSNSPVDYRQGSGGFNALSSVTLPDGSGWTFEYNSWGELKRLTNPLGTTVDYEWTTLNRINVCNAFNDLNPSPYDRAISKRTVTMPDKTLVWLYSYPFGSTGATVVTTPEGHTIRHGFGVDCGYREVETTYTDKTFGLQQTVSYEYTHGDANPWSQVDGDQSYTSLTLKRKTTTLPGGKVSQVCYIYDSDVDTDCQSTSSGSASDADFGSSPTVDGYPDSNGASRALHFSRGSLVKTIEHDYGSNSAGAIYRITSKSYKWQQSPDFLNAGMLDRLSSEEIRDGNGSVLASTTYSYDEANGSPQGVYGEMTGVIRTSGTMSIGSSTVYNGNGMPTQQFDGNGNPTSIAYDTSGLYPNSVTSGGLTSEYAVDLNTGVLTSFQDPNGVTTKYLHDDSLGRLSAVQAAYGIAGFGSNKTYQYPSLAATNVSQDLNATDDALLQSAQLADGLGRTTQTTGADGSIIDTVYDSNGARTAVSNPHFAAESTVKYTSYLFDVLGRVRRVCNPDNGQADPRVCPPEDSAHPDTSVQTYQYSDNQVTFTNESQHSWTRTSDALGRLTDLTEPGALQTHYLYDALNNLVKVTQDGSGEGARVREFFYDGFSRLVAAKNPEQGGGLSCAGAPGSQWSTCYTYDPNGNLKTKTIPWKTANGTITTNISTFDYDDSNRLIRKSFSDGVTPTSCFQYAKAADSSLGTYVVGRLIHSWTQPWSPTGTCPATVPQVQLTRRSISNYDPMGRIKNEVQCIRDSCTSGSPYTLAYSYDLVGNNTLSDNGVGSIAWTSSYDSNGRLSSISGTSGWTAPQFPTRLFHASQYNAVGMTDWTMGGPSAANPALTFHRDYDSRLRVTGESVLGHQ